MCFCTDFILYIYFLYYYNYIIVLHCVKEALRTYVDLRHTDTIFTV